MPRHRLLVLGLDGASFTVLDALADELPNIAKLRRRARVGVASSTMPPATLPAWPSFLTGSAPEVHGCVDLLMRDPASYALRPASGTDRRVPTLIEELAGAGIRCAALGFPSTSPPLRDLELCVSGFDSPAAHRAGPDDLWPPSLEPWVREFGGWSYATFNEQRGDPEEATAGLLADIKKKRNFIASALRSRSWDLFMVHLQASDTACHHLWAAWDRASPRASATRATDGLVRVFRALDDAIGEFVTLHGDGRVLLISDHGFGGSSDRVVYLNRFLHQRGLARFNRASTGSKLRSTLLSHLSSNLAPPVLSAAVSIAPPGLLGSALRSMRQPTLDLRGSTAFSDEVDYAPSIWFNRSDRFPDGVVAAEQVESLAAQLRGELLNLVDPVDGARLIEAVRIVRGNDLMQPDLQIVPAWPGGYRTTFLPSDGAGPVVARLTGDSLRGGRGLGMAGVHHPDGVLMVAGPDIAPGALRPTPLATVGAALPALLGFPLNRPQWRENPADLLDQLGLREEGSEIPAKPRPSERSAPKPNAAMAKRLEALGYL